MEYYHSKYGGSVKRKRKSRKSKILFWFVFLIVILLAIVFYYIHGIVFNANTWAADDKPVSVIIPSGSDFNEVKTILYGKGLILKRKDFEWLAKKKNYPDKIIPGRYLLKKGMSNNELINLLRSGNQTPVDVIFNNVRDIYHLAGKVSKQIEADSASIIKKLSDPAFLNQKGLSRETVSMIFIPNTYEFYWTTGAHGFVERMYEEYQKFWLGKRITRAAEIGLTPIEVVILASIVEKETNNNAEKPVIAGVYMNRLKNGWLLQADPTLIFALGDYSITRVLNVHKDVDSPYNTYLRKGLPPGPISIPSIASIDAVLNYQKNDYFFFCAKDDLSGSHVFAKNIGQHNQNARKYQEALNRMKIYN